MLRRSSEPEVKEEEADSEVIELMLILRDPSPLEDDNYDEIAVLQPTAGPSNGFNRNPGGRNQHGETCEYTLHIG